jgi:hypothetical protein
MERRIEEDEEGGIGLALGGAGGARGGAGEAKAGGRVEVKYPLCWDAVAFLEGGRLAVMGFLLKQLGQTLLAEEFSMNRPASRQEIQVQRGSARELALSWSSK